jgi:hypothetical protein
MAPYTDQAMETLMEEFEGLSIKKTAVHKFIKRMPTHFQESPISFRQKK